METDNTAGGRPRKAYSYIRFSTPEQGKGDSFRRQHELAKRYAQQHGLELDETLTFHDVGRSGYRGANYKAGRLAVFLEAVTAGHVEPGSVLLVEQLDRISRMDPLDAIDVLRDIVRHGVTVVTISDGREYTRESLKKDFTSLIMAVVLFMRANEESRTKSERGSAAWGNKMAQIGSKPLTSMTPAWIALDDATGKLELIEERAAVVRRIFEMAIGGTGVEAIANTFNAEGVDTWGRGKRKAKMWHRSYIARILKNPAAIGEITLHRTAHDEEGVMSRVPQETVRDYYPPVVSEEIFREANAAKAARGDRVRAPRALFPTQNLLAGLTACPKCGGSMVRVMKGKRSYPSLVCSMAKAGKACEYRSVRYALIEERLLRDLPARLRQREGLDATDGDLAVRIAETEDRLSHVSDDIGRLVDDLAAEDDENVRRILRQKLRQLAEARKDQSEELERLRKLNVAADHTIIAARVDRAIEALNKTNGEIDRAAANQALRTLFSRVIVNSPDGTLDFEWKAGGLCRITYAILFDVQASSNHESNSEQAS
ncbi:recombinase family protein [Sphingomonas trueperi]|uniref:recombinase family protein n=1 Tax=Sphingomonas trueperi TaxID=53317 RepID=UPI0011C35BF7